MNFNNSFFADTKLESRAEAMLVWAPHQNLSDAKGKCKYILRIPLKHQVILNCWQQYLASESMLEIYCITKYFLSVTT